MKLLSIIVCTYNRSRLLKKCLDSLLPQLTEEIEIIVIDNNSPDETAKVTKEYTINYHNIRYVFEKNIGLSYARNRGIKESKAYWILYIDDDAIAFPDLVERALYLVNRGDFDCVGGMYYGYYEGIKPKWISPEYGTKTLYSKELKECPFNIPHGGIVLYKKQSAISVNCFDPNFGMAKNIIRFGEEVNLQKRLYEKGYKIGFDPNLKVHHLNKRTNVKEQLIIKFELGKSHKYQFSENLTFSYYKFLKSLLSVFIRLPLNTYSLITKKQYYWQNVIIDTFGPTFYCWAKI